MSEAPTLLVEDLSVTLATAHGPLQAVRGINLSVSRGETLCIVGESGSGKSMTALALMDLLPAAASRRVRRLLLLGEELRDAPEARLAALRGDRMAMIFQDPTTSLNPSYAIGEQLVEGLLRHRPGLRRAVALDRAAALLATCGIGEPRSRLRQYPHQLSGGLRQRVMIAMALITEPALLIADEPTTALDVTVQVQILELLERLQRDFALAIILITHDLSVAGRIGSRAAVMYAGEIVESAPMPALLARPSHPYTRALLACAPSVEDGSRRELGFLPGQPPSLLGTLAGCQFRARCSLARRECEGIIPDRRTRSGDSYRCVIPPEEMPAFDAAHVAAQGPERLSPTARPGPAVSLRDIEVTYSVPQGLFAPKKQLHALRGVSIDVAQGEVLGVVGESGSGKSTLARVMLGLERPRQGQARILGEDVLAYGRLALARRVQLVFQDPYSSLNPRRRVGATIRLPLDLHGIGATAERQAEVRHMMELCGLPPRLAAAYPSQLSGGQRQRVAIASALITKPSIIICDEPTSALDVSVQAQILNLLRALRAEFGLTYILISHDLSVVRFLANRIAVVYLGEIVETGDAEQVFGESRHPYTRMLLDSASRRRVGAQLEGERPSAFAPPAGCAFQSRCPYAMPVCRDTPPPRRTAPGRSWICHLDTVRLPWSTTRTEPA